VGIEYKTDIDSKKKVAPRDREPNGAIFMLRCAELGLSKDDLDDMTVGMVFDMITEKANDHEKYDKKAPAGSMAAFFRGELNLGE
jgi:hypothetical protein